MLRFCRVFVLSCNIWSIIRAEFYTAVDDMQPLIQTHEEVIKWMKKYNETESKRLALIERILERFKIEESTAAKEGARYLENPINAYTLVKRLTVDLESIEKAIKSKNIVKIRKPVQYPTYEDLQGAAKAIARLELIYKLNTSDLANGVISGTFSHGNKPYAEKVTPMKSSDCFELARALYSENHYENGKPWMEEALRKLGAEMEWHYFTEQEVIDNITFAVSKVAQKKTMEENNIAILKKHKHICNTRPGRDKPDLCNDTRSQDHRLDHTSVLVNSAERYSALCRGEYDISRKVSKKLFCRYLRDQPFLLLAPVKMEQLYVRPDVFIAYDVISGSEINHVKILAKKKGLERAIVYDETGELVPSPDRISKYAWLPGSASDVIGRLSRRVADVTGLCVKWADSLQVVNYGVGGYYAPHYDFFRSSLVSSRGNRVATFLFYMSDVPQGGATVFPEPGLTVFPVRGAALFWFNLHSSGEGDLATYHAACPVLSGSKWVATKWLYTCGQEFRRPCGVQPDRKLKIPEPKLKIF